jgi:hypothetical protein
MVGKRRGEDGDENSEGLVMAQLMPNDAAFMQRVETLIHQAIVD